MNPVMLIFGTRLKEIRIERGFSRNEMAEVMKITNRAYSFYEEGKREPSYDKLAALACHLKVSIDYLLGLSDKP